ncbi:unnamed protein product [Clonostachys rhizophaga]|uniref:Alpha/beta hydrolase fold-3 domain-containing protein n=1 Tax=Clonostachys rhizophaga TaxID=160324 RepID=A0A9N9VNQ8_9HYPO|nr:unnamed protein product [Clonostachys rhizophaga]
MEEDGGSLLWLGDHNEASTVVRFLHGGGYIAPLLKGHLNWCRDVFLAAGAETGTKVAVAVLEYTLCPEARFPTQLRQAIGAVNTLLSSGFPPEKILLGGDSAGGISAAQLLCQIARPNALLPPIQTSRPLQAAFMVSPWLSRHTNDYSYQFNERIEILSSHTVKKSVAYLMGDNHNSCSMCDLGKLAFPIDSGTACFQGLDTAVRHLYITAGEQEVMKDQIVAFTEGVIKFNPKINVEFILQKEQAHYFILIEGQQGVPGICTEGMKAWNAKLSDPTDPTLSLQGVGWMTQKLIRAATITLQITQYSLPAEVFHGAEADENVVHINIEQTLTKNLKGTTEKRCLTNEWHEHSDWLFGKVRGKAKRASYEELGGDDLKAG